MYYFNRPKRGGWDWSAIKPSCICCIYSLAGNVPAALFHGSHVMDYTNLGEEVRLA